MISKAEKIHKQHRYPLAVIEAALALHINKEKTFRSIAETLNIHGVKVSHKTVYEWVQKFEGVAHFSKAKNHSDFQVEESLVKCNGQEVFMYRAVDKSKKTISVYLREKKNQAKAYSFFKEHLE